MFVKTSFITDTGGYKPTDGRVYAMDNLLGINSHSPVPGDVSKGYLGRMLSAALLPSTFHRYRDNYSLDTRINNEMGYELYNIKTSQTGTYIH